MDWPVVEAYLLCPEEGKEGGIGICTNYVAPSMVVNEISFDHRKHIAAMGSLVVNRDGAERLIVNCLSHPTMHYLILFGDETLSFRPSTNLLNAIMHGYDETQQGNQINGGIAMSPHYPSIPAHLLRQFTEKIIVVPLHTYKKGQEKVVEEYTAWLQDKVPTEVHETFVELRKKNKVYYDGLNKMIEVLSTQPVRKGNALELNPADFQHLQPPITLVNGQNEILEMPFSTRQEEDQIVADIDFGNTLTSIKGTDSWLIAYSINQYMQENNFTLTALQTLLLGVELSRAEISIRNKITSESHIRSITQEGPRHSIPLAARTLLKADKKYYYKIGLKEGQISVQSLAHDTCESVFELRSRSLTPLIKKIAENNRFDNYEQATLHRLDVGIETGRASIALSTQTSYFQDFRNLFTINSTRFPLFITEADSFLNNHKQIITKLYTNGMTLQHPDAHKGPMRSGAVLAVYRRAQEALEQFPNIYRSGEKNTTEMRKDYATNLLMKENDGSYTYGQRTRSFFKNDQILSVIDQLLQNPTQTAIIQRFDYEKDMGIQETPILDAEGNTIRTRIESTKDPCLSHDIYWINNKKLHSFHIARAHNIVNAYPENIFGLHDAYDKTIAEGLGIERGDMFMLSSRANILLLTEEQKAKKLIAEPAKPVGTIDYSEGPYNMHNNSSAQGVGYIDTTLREEKNRPEHPCLDALENYHGQNLIIKAANYLKKKGKKHNNPIIGTFNPQTREQEKKNRLVFFQCNQRGKELHATAVFLGGNKNTEPYDISLCNYIATQYKKIIEGVELGKLFLFYTPVTTTETVKENTAIKCIGFDLDQTLYPKSPQIDEAIQSYLYDLISKHREISRERAKELFQEYYPRLSGRKTLITLGVPNANNAVQEALERADIDKFLQPNTELRQLLEELKKKYSLALITGSGKQVAEKKLEKLNLPQELFNVIITGERSKRDGTAYNDWMLYEQTKDASLSAKNFLYIGDRKVTDVDEPRKLGMEGWLVNTNKKEDGVGIFEKLVDIRKELL